MDPLNDPTVMNLPHPVRCDAAMGGAFDTQLFDNLGLSAELKPYLTDDSISTEWLLNHVKGMRLMALTNLFLPAGSNMGTFVLMMNRARLRAWGDPLIRVAPALQTLLAETDLATGLPARFFRCPYPLAYVAFARPNPWRVLNRVSGLHELEGAYVGTYQLPPYHEMHHTGSRDQALGLDPAKPTRLVEIVLIGSPVGKQDALDDASQDLVLFIQDEDECLDTLLARHLAYYQKTDAYNLPGMVPATPREAELARPLVYELAKVLLYLNLPEAEQLRVAARDDLERKLRKYGKLTASRRARLASAYNHILIGPPAMPKPDAAPSGTGAANLAHQGLRPHWRRGHFRRIRYGEKLSESRLGWIQPYLVKKNEAFGVVKPKEYVVR